MVILEMFSFGYFVIVYCYIVIGAGSDLFSLSLEIHVSNKYVT